MFKKYEIINIGSDENPKYVLNVIDTFFQKEINLDKYNSQYHIDFVALIEVVNLYRERNKSIILSKLIMERYAPDNVYESVVVLIIHNMNLLLSKFYNYKLPPGIVNCTLRRVDNTGKLIK